VAEGLVTREQIMTALKMEKGVLCRWPCCGLACSTKSNSPMSVKIFPAGNPVRHAVGSSGALLKQFGEVQSTQANAIPVGERNVPSCSPCANRRPVAS